MQDKNDQERNNRPRRSYNFIFILLVTALIVGLIIFLVNTYNSSRVKVVTYKEFEQYVVDNKIDTSKAVEATPINDNYDLYYISGTLTDGVTFRVAVTTDRLNAIIITNQNLNVKIIPATSNFWLSFLLSLLPYLILMIPLFFIFRSLMRNGGTGGAIDFAKSTAKLSKKQTVTFKDVAGCDEEKEELVEIIDFLKNPKKYNEIGARIPKGVILFGPPGTGKTLLAKAVAGEAGVAFYSISGSDFVEMFVGVGAARVRDMFKTAKENAPCIIFMDEIDAVGRQRGAGMGGGHDEREQTLNQLLVEMDGFNGNTGIIIMAATNRPDVLDPALLRPGRFDRQITISNPDVRGREAILKVHARNKHIDPAVKFDEIASRTPGFSGADIENLLNEAALLAARENRKVINVQDIDEAIDRVMMGPAKKSRKYTDKERKLVAYHEAGHAVIGLKLEDASTVQKITIVPRGQAGGYNLMMPKEETFFQTKTQLYDTITGFLGGRVAEELMFGDVSTGAHNDFEQATKIARAMVTEYGMSNLGPIQYEQPQGSVFLGRDYLKDKNFSDQVALEIDKEVRKIIEECYDRAREVISSNKELLTNIAEYLLKLETINKSEIDEIAATGHIAWYDKLHEAKKPEEPKVEEAPVDAESVQAEPTEAVEAKTEPVKEEKAEATEDKPAEEAPKKPRAPRKKKTEEPKEEENK
ncbi:MAG: ATP-dependent zinc metalloprotease FtsH [Acholeplasmatales bacterium]|nr:ATP-dependent zinc metalloprotease FtsH [Acholeplasmatales bacterium]